MSDPAAVSPALALITRLHEATREIDALQWHDDVEFHRVLALNDKISTIADELTALLGLSIGDAWAPLLSERPVLTQGLHS
jgi:hypothetical protein